MDNELNQRIGVTCLVHVCAGILVELVAAAEDDESDLTVAEDGQFVGLLHHTELPLVKGHLRIKLAVECHGAVRCYSVLLQCATTEPVGSFRP